VISSDHFAYNVVKRNKVLNKLHQKGKMRQNLISTPAVYEQCSSGSEQQASGGIGSYQADPGMANKWVW
jgi:hypothetical protein